MKTKFNPARYFPKQKVEFSMKGEYDSYIAAFMTKLNTYPDIVTFYSCEGFEHEDRHREDKAYIYFNISERIWIPFWSEFMPIFLHRYARDQHNRAHDINIGVSEHKKPMHHAGLFIECHDPHDKERFWKTFKKELIPFLDKYSKNGI